MRKGKNEYQQQQKRTNEPIPTWLKYSYKRSCFHFTKPAASATKQANFPLVYNQLWENFKIYVESFHGNQQKSAIKNVSGDRWTK
jgi:hypothetical protein